LAPILFRDSELHARHAVYGGATDRGLRRLDHIGYIGERDAGATLVHQNRVSYVLGCDRLPLALKHDSLVCRVDEARAADTRCALRRAQDVVQANVEADELIGIDLDLNRLRVAAEHSDLCHARHREQPWPDGPIGDRAQLHQRAFSRCQASDKDNACGGRERSHRGRLDTRRQLQRFLGEPFGYELPVAVNVARRIESDGNDRESLDRRRTQGAHAGSAIDDVL
jgi:hypothetical protein